MIRIGSVDEVAATSTSGAERISPLVPRPRGSVEVGAPTHPPVP